MEFRSSGRKGLSLLEVLVVICILGVLAALVLPGVQSTRGGNSRRSECMNNMRNVGVAFQNYVSVFGVLPAAGYWDVPPEDVANYDTWRLDWDAEKPGAGAKTMRYSWALMLLSYLERSDVYDLWDFGADPEGRPTYGSYLARSTKKNPKGGDATLADTSIKVLTCPADPTLIQGRGNLSFVLNGGFNYHWRMRYAADGSPQGPHLLADWSNAEAKQASEDLWNRSLFSLQTTERYASAHRLANVDRRWRTWSSIDNGLTNTVMISENINAGIGAYWEDAGTSSNWACPHPWNTCFFVNGWTNGCGWAPGGAPQWRLERANFSGADAPPINPLGAEGGINGDLSGMNEGRFPYPNSGHGGGVNVMFCDGGVRFVEGSISGKVWARMVIPNSKKPRPSDGLLNGAAQEDGIGGGGTRGALNDEF